MEDWILTIRSPKSRPTEYTLKPGVNTLGRKSTSDIVIADESASRLHAEILCQSETITLRDLGSTNGTYLNQKRLVEPHILTPGDQIRIGHHLATLSREETPSPEPSQKDNNDTGSTSARQITSEFILESVEQNAVLIYEVANRLTTVLEIDKALEEIAHFLQVAIGAEKCKVIFANQLDQINQLGFPSTFAKLAIQQHSSVIYPDPENPLKPGKSPDMPKVSSALCVPILSDGETIAMVYAIKRVSSTRNFDHHDLTLAVAVSHQAALAIQRSQILKNARMLKKWAFTDSLTGLDNRRQILKKGEIECSRTNRFHHPLTVILLDIDDFKQINNQYGHPSGDRVLKTIARRCANELRDVDLIGRYGGDEFLILLVETRLDKAVIAAGRLLRKIAEKPVQINGRKLQITVSMGITYIHEGYAELDELIDRADQALLEAKKRGKNKFEVLL